MATITDVYNESQVIKNETAVGANTATRVGTAFEDVADVLGQLEITGISVVADSSSLTITLTQGGTAHNFTLPIVTATKVGIAALSAFKTIDGNNIIGSGDIDITSNIVAMLSNYQQLLQSGVNIKTLEGQSLLGAGDIQLASVFAATLAGYQQLLQSGTNIKTINGQSLLGSGNINIEEGGQIDTTGFATLDTALGQLEYSQTPIVVLKSMGSTLDNVDTTEPPYIAYHPVAGDTYYDPNTKMITYLGGTTELYLASQRLIYCNAQTGRLYRWVNNSIRWSEVGSKVNSSVMTIAAGNVVYNPAMSGLTSYNAQDAIDEMAGDMTTLQTAMAQKLNSSALATLNGARMDLGGNVNTTLYGTITYAGGSYSCNKTYSQLYIAYSSGTSVGVIYNDEVYMLSGADGSSMSFASGVSRFSVDTSNNWSYSASTYAPINSPTFTGTPAAPTPSAVSNDTTIATTAFVQTAISGIPTADAPVVVTLTESGGVYSIDYDVQDLQTELSGMELPSSVLMFEDNPDIITLRLVNAQKEVDHNGVTEKTTIWSGVSDGICYVVSAYYDSVNLVDVVEMYVEDTILNKVSVSGSASVTQALSPSTFYSFETALTDLTITLTATTGQGLPIYGGRFTADAGGCSMTIPAGVTAASGNPSIAASKTYEFNILDNILILLEL